MYLSATRGGGGFLGIHIIDLEQTIPMMRRALNFVRDVYDKRGKLQGCRRDMLSRAHRRREEKQFIPEALFLLSVSQPRSAPLLRSSTKLQIPVIAIVDSDADPSGIQYPVPANDDSHLHKELILDATVEADENELRWPKPQFTRNDQRRNVR